MLHATESTESAHLPDVGLPTLPAGNRAARQAELRQQVRVTPYPKQFAVSPQRG